MKLLILCTGNSCRSQMAEGFFRAALGDRAEIYSAGVEAHGINPYAARAMAEVGIDINTHTSDLVGKYLGVGITHLITVCDSAAQLCPAFPEQTVAVHHSFPDPADATGTDDEKMVVYREVRDAIRAYSAEWAAEYLPA
ncbi:MAG: arsenate reductase ArsC [Bacteroidota bacterium]